MVLKDIRQDASEVKDAWTESRIQKVEDAITVINHASTEMAKWAGNVNGQLMWIKILVGATAVAAFGQLVVSAIYSGIVGVP
mgnify:FL=1